MLTLWPLILDGENEKIKDARIEKKTIEKKSHQAKYHFLAGFVQLRFYSFSAFKSHINNYNVIGWLVGWLASFESARADFGLLNLIFQV